MAVLLGSWVYLELPYSHPSQPPSINTPSHRQVAEIRPLYPDFLRKKFRRKKVAYV